MSSFHVAGVKKFRVELLLQEPKNEPIQIILPLLLPKKKETITKIREFKYENLQMNLRE